MTLLPIIIVLYSSGAIANIVNGEANADSPLDLTAYLERGEADKARKLSAVDPTLFAGVQSHAAFFNVNKTNKWHTFFWFFPAENKPLDSTPWILWLGGSSGGTILDEIFEDNLGPLFVEKMTAFRQDVTINKNYSILYIDNPIRAGFSYSEEKDKFATNVDEVGECLLSFIQQFLQVFAELQKAPLFISGHYLGPRYALALGRNIHHHWNSSIAINLKGFLLNSPWMDPPSFLHYSDLLAQIGIIDYGAAAEMKQLEEAARKAWEEGDYERYHQFYRKVYNAFKPYFYSTIRINKFTEDIGLPYMPPMLPYMNQSSLRSAIHVGDLKVRLYNDEIFDHLGHVYLRTTKPLLEDLLEHYGVLCYSWQLDVWTGHAILQHMYRDLKWSGAQDYLNAKRVQIWSEHPTQTLNPIGYSKGAGNFEEVMIRSYGRIPHLQIVSTFIEKFK